MRSTFRHLRIPFASIVLAFLVGCASESFDPKTAPEYIVIRDFTPFYTLGPQQARGPDVSLRADTRFKLLRREMGFSFIQLEDSRTGYVANESIAVAPPRPPAPKIDEVALAGSKKRGSANSPLYLGPALNDTPLPNAPAPDLNIQPEIVPDTVPAPAPTPSEPPRFRY